MNKLKRTILHSKPVKATIGYLQQRQFPGYEELNWYAVIEFFIRWVDTREIRLRASSLSYTFFLALFPSVIFIFTLIAYLPFKNSEEAVLNFFAGILPENAYLALKSTILDILKNQHGSLLSIGFFTAMYFSTNGFVSLMKAFNKYARHKEKRSFWKQRLVAILLSFVVSVSLLISVAMITLASFIIHQLDHVSIFSVKLAPLLVVLLNYAIVAAIILLIVSTIYYLAPSHGRTSSYRFISPGSVFASVIILLSTTIFSSYVNQFNSYNKVYGSIGVLIVLMLLIYISTYILLLGYELNVAIDRTVSELRKNGVVKANKIILLHGQENDQNQ